MAGWTFTIVAAAGDDGFAIRLPFDPREAWGRTRAPVVVAIGEYRYRSTVTTIGGQPWIPFRRSHRDAAGVREGVPVEVTVILDTEPRTVEAPADLLSALDAAGVGGEWDQLSYTHQREHFEAIEGAKKPETRARRITRCVEQLIGAR